MVSRSRCLLCACALLILSATIAPAMAAPVTSAFTYQGELQSGGVPVNGTIDVRVTLFNAATDGVNFGPPLVRTGVSVVAGRFTLSDLDFGSSAFNEARWLQIEVRSPSDPGNTAAFTTLSPRQPITSAPNAVLALSANTLGGLSSAFYTNAANLNNGVLQSARLAGTYSSPLTLNNAANVFAGSGAGLTGLNASSLALGTVPDARLPLNLLRLDAASATVSGGQLTISAPGSTTAGISGFPEVVFVARSSNAGQHSAITIDGKPGFDGVLYLAENGSPVWGIRSDSSEGKDFQIRLHDGGVNTVMFSMDTTGAVGIGTPPVFGARLTVSGAVIATGGITFGDGSVLQSATGVVAQPTVNYTNGLPVITWNGGACDIDDDIEIGVDVIETMNVASQAKRVSPGLVVLSDVTISRRFTTNDTSWITAASSVNATNYATSGRSLVITRGQSSPAGSATLTIPDLVPVNYRLVRDAAGVREVLTLRSVTGTPALPVFSGSPPTGGTIDRATGLTLLASGLAFPATALDVTAPSRAIQFTSTYPPGSRQPVSSFGTLLPFRLTARTPFGVNPVLRNWANDIIVNGLTVRRTITVRSGTTTVFTSPGLGGFPSTYRIKRGTDGQIYEEVDIVTDGG